MRASWERYFLCMAKLAASRSTCPRASVGCVLVRDRRILATGYNGSMAGEPHCTGLMDTETDATWGCFIVNGHCQRTVHAELNAISNAAYQGVSVNDALAYVTHRPCWRCLGALVNAGIARVMFTENYGEPYPMPSPIEVVNVP